MGDSIEQGKSYDERVEAFKSKIKEYQSLFGKTNRSLADIDTEILTESELTHFLAYRNLLQEMEQILLLPDFEEMKKQLKELNTKVEELKENIKNTENKFLGWLNNRLNIFTNIDYITDPNMPVTPEDIHNILQEVQSEIKTFSE